MTEKRNVSDFVNFESRLNRILEDHGTPVHKARNRARRIYILAKDEKRSSLFPYTGLSCHFIAAKSAVWRGTDEGLQNCLYILYHNEAHTAKPHAVGAWTRASSDLGI